MKKLLLLIVVLAAGLLAGCIGEGIIAPPDVNGNDVPPQVFSGTLQVTVGTPEGDPVPHALVTVKDRDGRAVFEGRVMESQYIRDLSSTVSPYTILFSCPEGYTGSEERAFEVNRTGVISAPFVCYPDTPDENVMRVTVNVLDHFNSAFPNASVDLIDKNEMIVSSKDGASVRFENVPVSGAPYRIGLECGENRRATGIDKEIDFDPFGPSATVRCIPALTADIISNRTLIPDWAFVNVQVNVRPESTIERDITVRALGVMRIGVAEKPVFEEVVTTTTRRATLRIVPTDYIMPPIRYEVSVYCGERYSVPIVKSYLYAGDSLSIDCNLARADITTNFKDYDSGNLLQDLRVTVLHTVDRTRTLSFSPTVRNPNNIITINPGTATVYGYGTLDGSRHYCSPLESTLALGSSSALPSSLDFRCVKEGTYDYSVNVTGGDGEPLSKAVISVTNRAGRVSRQTTGADGQVILRLRPSDYYFTVNASCSDIESSTVYEGGIKSGKSVLPEEMSFSFPREYGECW